MAEKWQGKSQGGSGVWRDKDSLFQSLGSGEICRTLGSAAGGNPELEGMNALEGMKGAQLQLGPPSLGGSLAKHTHGPTGEEEVISEDGQGSFSLRCTLLETSGGGLSGWVLMTSFNYSTGVFPPAPPSGPVPTPARRLYACSRKSWLRHPCH